MNRPFLLAAAALVLVAGCKPKDSSKAPAADSATVMTPSAPAADTTARAPTPGLDDPTIVAIFDAANTYDIETSKLALQKSKNPSVKAIAQQFVNDHTTVRQEGRDLATKLGVHPTPPVDYALGAAHAAAMTDLQSKSGAEFDKAYINNEVTYHQDVITAVNNTLLPSIQNAELKALVQKVAPAFQAHLDAAKALQTKLNDSAM